MIDEKAMITAHQRGVRAAQSHTQWPRFADHPKRLAAQLYTDENERDAFLAGYVQESKRLRARARAVEAVVVVGLLLASWQPGEAQQARQRVLRDSHGTTTGTASTDSQGTTTFRDAQGRTVGTATSDSQGNVTYRDDRGNVTGTAGR